MAAYDDNYQPSTTSNKRSKLSKHIPCNSSSGLFANAIKEGWILKKGPQKLAGWKKRYLQLSSKQQLGYYTDESMVCKKGTIFLKNLTIHHIKRSSKTSDSKHHGFCVVTPSRTYQFCVASSTDRDHWIQKIREVVDDKWDAHKIEKPSISYTQTDKTFPNNTFQIQPKKYGYNNENAYGDWDDDDDDQTHSSATFKIKQNLLKDRNNNNSFLPYTNNNNNNDMDIKSKYKRNDEQIQLSEAEAQERIQIFENKNDELLDEALKTTYDTQNIAADTAEKLDSQRHQLINVDKNLHEIDQDLDKTEGILDGMKSWSGMIKKKFKKNKDIKDEYNAPINEKSAFERNEDKLMENSNGMPTQISQYEADNKQNEKLDELLKNMKVLNKTAQDINQELDEQDVIIDAISDKMDKVQPRMQQQNKTMKKICK